jgi:hypothetical protein
MKAILLLTALLLAGLCANAQQFWIENWTGTNCAQGCLTYSGPNGAWSVVQSGYNGPDSNAWYFSEMETGEGRGACGAGSSPPATAHVSFTANSPFIYPLCSCTPDQGAQIDDYSGAPSTQTNLRLESPVINCTGKSNIKLSFNYIMGNSGADDYATVWYFDGSSWALLASPPPTGTCINTQGLWTYYSVALPLSANGNPNVKIGFNWHNDTMAFDDNYLVNNAASLVSFAVDSIALSVTCPVMHDSIIINHEVSCFNGNNGNVTATATNGTAPYTFSWSPAGGTNSNATGLTAGSYTVTVKDANGCHGTASVTITQPPALNVSTDSIVNVNCNGAATGSATASVSGGTPGYTYNWSNGETTNTATGLSAGSYTFTVTDANGCVASAVANITQPNALIVSISTDRLPSSPSFNNGELNAVVVGGTPGYNYLWTPGGQTTDTAKGLTAGTYKVCVTDAWGCEICDSLTLANSTAGVQNIIAGGQTMVIYPNPAGKTISLMFGEAIGSDARICITDIAGREVEEQVNPSFAGNIIKLDISKLDQGIYFVRACTAQWQSVAKFIKQ